MAFMPPQFYILSTLSDILQGSENTKEQSTRVKELSSGNFGKQVINPVAKGKDDQGRTILTYEGDELRGGPKGRTHRAHLKMSKGVSFRVLARTRSLIGMASVCGRDHTVQKL